MTKTICGFLLVVWTLGSFVPPADEPFAMGVSATHLHEPVHADSELDMTLVE